MYPRDIGQDDWMGITALRLTEAVRRAYPHIFHPRERLILAANSTLLREEDGLDGWVRDLADFGVLRAERPTSKL